MSLAAVDANQLDSALLAYLRDVHALEGQAETLLETGAERVEDEHLEAAFRDHLEETQRHRKRIAKLSTRSSIIFGSWLGIRGRRRSLGRSISRPWRSTWRFQA